MNGAVPPHLDMRLYEECGEMTVKSSLFRILPQNKVEKDKGTNHNSVSFALPQSYKLFRTHVPRIH
jgi:hypothetical protein